MNFKQLKDFDFKNIDIDRNQEIISQASKKSSDAPKCR